MNFTCGRGITYHWACSLMFAVIQSEYDKADYGILQTILSDLLVNMTELFDQNYINLIITSQTH